MSWEETTVRKLRAGPPPSLGQSRFDAKGREKPLGPSVSKPAAHALCLEHVEVAGLREPVCITPGADRDRLIAEARELAGAE